MGRTGNRRYRTIRAAIVKAGGNCCICGKPVDTNLKWPDPLSPSADHKVAYADGGSDSRSNLRIAHLGCNSARGKRDAAPIIKRSGSLNLD